MGAGVGLGSGVFPEVAVLQFPWRLCLLVSSFDTVHDNNILVPVPKRLATPRSVPKRSTAYQEVAHVATLKESIEFVDYEVLTRYRVLIPSLLPKDE